MQWALRKLLMERGGEWLLFRELPGDRKPQRGEGTPGRPGVDGWRGAKRERREVGELRRVGPREEWGREKKGVEKGKGTHPQAGQEGEEGGLRWGGRAGAGQEEGGRAAPATAQG